MARSVYVTAMEPGSSKSAVVLGLAEVLSQHAARLAFYRPLAPPPTRITPLMFEQALLERTRADRRHIVLPEGNDDRILAAAEQLLLRGVADMTVLGRPEAIAARATVLGFGLPGVRVLDPSTSPDRKRFAEVYAELRNHKGVVPLQRSM